MGFTEFQTQLRAALAAAGDGERAEQQRRYLKTDAPMYGVRVPVMRKLTVALAQQFPDLWEQQWGSNVRRVWDEAVHREERFAALAIVRAPFSSLQAARLDALPVYEHFVRTGQWWDLVDETSHGVGQVLVTHPGQASTMREWAQDEDMWIRRSSIICQLQLAERTDLTLLTDVIELNQADPEFFIRKAIGWALRDYARTGPDWVRGFVAAHPGLSNLSRREAMKHL